MPRSKAAQAQKQTPAEPKKRGTRGLGHKTLQESAGRIALIAQMMARSRPQDRSEYFAEMARRMPKSALHGAVKALVQVIDEAAAMAVIFKSELESLKQKTRARPAKKVATVEPVEQKVRLVRSRPTPLTMPATEAASNSHVVTTRWVTENGKPPRVKATVTQPDSLPPPTTPVPTPRPTAPPMASPKPTIRPTPSPTPAPTPKPEPHTGEEEVAAAWKRMKALSPTGRPTRPPPPDDELDLTFQVRTTKAPWLAGAPASLPTEGATGPHIHKAHGKWGAE